MSNIIWAKVKFSRNLKDMLFTHKMSDVEQDNALKLCLETIEACGLKGEAISNMSEQTVNNLAGNGMIEKSFLSNPNIKGYASNKKVAVQINGKSHIEVFSKADDIYSAYNEAKKIDKKLCNKLSFSYNDKYGFLNPSIDKVGCGMEIEILILLPALTQIGAFKSLPKSIEKLMFKIESVDESCNLYMIKSGANLGYTEKQICELTKSYIDNIIRCEIEASKTLSKDADEVLDKCERAIAIINHCIKIDTTELLDLISKILIAVNGGVKQLEDADGVKKIINSINNNLDEKTLAKIIKNNLN